MNGKRKRAPVLSERENGKSKKSKDDFFIFDGADAVHKDSNKIDEKIDNKKLESETPEEKRLRLAQEYLKKVEEELDEEEELRDKESQVDRDSLISNKLKQQSFEGKGKRKRKLGAQLTGKTLSGDSVKFYRGHHLSVTCIVLSQDGRYAFTGSKDCSIIKWDVDTGKKLFTFPGSRHSNQKSTTGHTAQVLALALSSDGKFLASSGKDQLIKIWDANTNKLIDTFKGHRDIVSALAFRMGSHQLFSGSHDRTVKIWNIDEMAYVETLFGHQSEVTCLDSLLKERAISTGNDRTARIWKVVEEAQLVFKGHTASIDCVSLQSEDTYATGSQDGSVAFWNSTKKKPVHTIKNAHESSDGTAAWISSLSACKFTDLVASGAGNGSIHLWKTEEGNSSVSHLTSIAVPGFINGLAFSHDARILVAGVGKEHRMGRWSNIKEARNGIAIIRLPIEKE